MLDINNREPLFRDERTSTDTYEHCWEFKECENLDDYIRKYLNSEHSDIDIDEAAYQYLYDTSNDWLKEAFSSVDIQNAFVVGALWMRHLFENKNVKN